MAMPQGEAHSDYSRPCPGCMRAIVKGDMVIKVTLPGRRSEWWHDGCRREYVKVLCLED